LIVTATTTPTALFQSLGAPLYNHVWSWGAVHPATGTVYLRVWSDEIIVDGDGRRWVRVANHTRYHGRASLGYRERMTHLALARGGSPVVLLVHDAADPTARPRRIASFTGRAFRGGKLTDHTGSTWMEVLAGMQLSSLVNLADPAKA
jgi:hypothetical protein